MEDFGYVKDENKRNLSQTMRKVALSCATLFSISCFIYVTISAYYYFYEEENGVVETIKSPEMPIKVIEADQVAIRDEGPKIDDSIYEDIFGNKKESLEKIAPKIRLSPEPALPPVDSEAAHNISETDNNSSDKNSKIAIEKNKKTQQQIIVYNDKPSSSSQDLLSKNNAAKAAPTKQVSDQKLDKNKSDKRRYVRVQLAAMTSKKAAEEYWKKVSSSSTIFSGLKSFTEEVDLGKKGIFYRLQVGNFSDQIEAENFCKKYTLQLNKSKADCIVVE